MKISPINQDHYLGQVKASFLGYSNDEKIRTNAASGGIISSLLYTLLNKNMIDGALVCRQIISANNINYEVKIVSDPQEILDFATSVYFDIPILKSLDLIKNFNGKLAVVGLPCQLKSLSKLCENNEEIPNKIYLKIGLFCGHNSRKELLIDVLEKKGIQENEVKKVIFRKGHWRGKMHVLMKKGKETVFPFQHFSMYQNLHFDSLKKCIYCHDHTAEYADISCGDAWLPYLKKDKVKHSIVIARNEKGNDILKELRRKGHIYLMKVEPEIVFASQKRSIIYHKGIEARSKVGKIFGYRIDYPANYKDTARWNDYLAALIVLMNIKLSYNPTMRKIIFLVPRKLWYPYLIAFKLLTNF